MIEKINQIIQNSQNYDMNAAMMTKPRTVVIFFSKTQVKNL